MEEQLPKGIISVRRIYKPDKKKMIKALRVILEASARDGVQFRGERGEEVS